MLLHAHGAPNVGNSFEAIKKLVFDEKKIAAKDIEDALRPILKAMNG